MYPAAMARRPSKRQPLQQQQQDSLPTVARQCCRLQRGCSSCPLAFVPPCPFPATTSAAALQQHVASLDSVAGWLSMGLTSAADRRAAAGATAALVGGDGLHSRMGVLRFLHDAAVAVATANFDVLDFPSNSGAAGSPGRTVLRCMPAKQQREWLWGILPGEDATSKLDRCPYPLALFLAAFELMALLTASGGGGDSREAAAAEDLVLLGLLSIT